MPCKAQLICTRQVCLSSLTALLVLNLGRTFVAQHHVCSIL